jgi:hypothetical protein
MSNYGKVALLGWILVAPLMLYGALELGYFFLGVQLTCLIRYLQEARGST